MSARSRNRVPARARVPKLVREQAMRINARISELANERMEILKAGAAGLGIDLEKNDYRLSEDWQFYERVVIPLPKQIRRARSQKKAS